MFGVYIDDREAFDKAWDSGEYEPGGCIYLESKYIIMPDAGQQAEEAGGQQAQGGISDDQRTVGII